MLRNFIDVQNTYFLRIVSRLEIVHIMHVHPTLQLFSAPLFFYLLSFFIKVDKI